MDAIQDLQPKEFFRYFEEISRIPRGSGNTKKISDYLAAFAAGHGLECIQDKDNNIILIKEASKGCEHIPALILQGHMDMVCEKEADCELDMETDGLELMYDGTYISARGTTLGADDGVAVAYALALLADEKLKHPRLEVILTVDEEIGLLGAASVDVSMLKGKYMVNIDSDVEGMFLASCAGGQTSECVLQVDYVKKTRPLYKIKIVGLQGGHSGAEIDKYRGNSNKLMGRFLYFLGKDLYFGIVALAGGSKDNAIPRETTAELFVKPEDCKLLEEKVQEFDGIIKAEFAGSDPDVYIEFESLGEQERDMLSAKSREFVQFFLMNLPNGVQNMSQDIKGLVQTSLNLGIVRLDKEALTVTLSLRSASESEREALSDQIAYLTEFLGGEYTVNGEYPAWPYKKDSKLRSLVCRAYENQFHEKAKIEAIHAGLECGLFSEKIEGLDTISMGPEVLDIHTPKERMNAASVARYYELLRTIISEFDKIES